MSREWLDLIAPAVRKCGQRAHLNLIQGKNRGNRKKQNEWVTQTDLDVEKQLIYEIRNYFDDHDFLGEEGGLTGESEHCWVIDPIDGTTNFVHGFPQSAISLAYCHKGRPRLAIIYDFHRDELYTAIAGEGAFMNGERLRVSETASFDASMFIISGSIYKINLWHFAAQLAPQTDGARRTGSTVMDLAYLASGKVDAIISGPVNFWDVAAGSLLIREAGGLISDVSDQTNFSFNTRTDIFVAATPKLFARYFTETKEFIRGGKI